MIKVITTQILISKQLLQIYFNSEHQVLWTGSLLLLHFVCGSNHRSHHASKHYMSEFKHKYNVDPDQHKYKNNYIIIQKKKLPNTQLYLFCIYIVHHTFCLKYQN